jgi:molybdate transport system ATP-binding protein
LSSTASPVLEVELVRTVHPGLTLDVRLSLDREIGVIFGTSGAGKTTFLRLISGLLKPDRGRIKLDGDCLFDSSRRIDRPMRRRRIGMIYQEDHLFPHLKVVDNVKFGLNAWRHGPAKARVAEVAALCGIESLLHRWPATLSGGERQRVGLARALAPRPRLLLCDEPVSALDMTNRYVMVERLRAVQRSESIPILYVTHSPSEALAIGTQIFLLKQGSIVARGLPLDILPLVARGGNAAGGPEELRNVFAATVRSHDPLHAATRIEIEAGPELIVPFLERAVGSRVLVSVRADDILLTREPVTGLSARNQIAGTVDRIVIHGPEAEVIVRTAQIRWIVSVVAQVVDELHLAAGGSVVIIMKARSCHLFDSGPAQA